MLKPPQVLVREVLAGCSSSGLVCHLLGKKANHHWTHPAWDSLRPFICWCFWFPLFLSWWCYRAGGEGIWVLRYTGSSKEHVPLCVAGERSIAWGSKGLRLKRREEHPKLPIQMFWLLGITAGRGTKLRAHAPQEPQDLPLGMGKLN